MSIKRLLSLVATLALLIVTSISYSQNVGIGQKSPASKLDVKGNLTIGSTYSGTAAPSNGAIIQGNVGIGTTLPTSLFSVGSTSQFQVNSSGDIISVKGVAYSWPTTAPTSGQVLTAGSMGTLSWSTPGGGSGTITNVTASSPLASSGGTTPNITLGTVGVANGGTGATTLTSDGIIYGNGTSAVGVTAAGSQGQHLTINSSGVPVWTTATFPSITTANQLLYSSATNTVTGLSTADNAVLTTNSSGVPSWLTAGTNGQVLTMSSGVPTWVNASGSSLTSTYIGYGSGSNSLTGDANFIRNSYGINLQDNSTNHNIFIGTVSHTAGNSSTTGTDNTAIGNNVLVANSSGSNNVVLGYSSLNGNTSGSNNVAIGNNAVVNNTTANGNTGIGNYALKMTTLGAYNTVVGDSAFYSNTVGKYNVSMGYQTKGSTAALNNTITIGAFARATSSNELVVDSAVTAYNLSGVSYSLPTSQGAANTVLTNNGSGTLSWAASSSGGVAGVTATSPISSSGGTTPNISLGTVPVSDGGTGSTSLTSNGVIYGSGTGAVGVTSAGTEAELLTANTSGNPAWTGAATAGEMLTLGTSGAFQWIPSASVGDVLTFSSSGVPVWSTQGTSGEIMSISTSGLVQWTNAGATAELLTTSTSNQPMWTSAGTAGEMLSVANSGQLTWTPAGGAGQVMTANSSGIPTWLAAGSNGQVLSMDNSGTLQWETLSTGATAANDGLSLSGSTVQLGGSTSTPSSLTQNTEITQNGDNMIYDLGTNSSAGNGTFSVEDGGSGNPYLYIKNASSVPNIGIGTSSPAAHLNINNGHIRGDQTTAPTVAVTTAAGITGASIASNSTDMAGTVNTTGTNNNSSYTEVTVTFKGETFNIAPFVEITPINKNGSECAYYVTSTTTGFSLYFQNQNSGSAVSFNYMVIE